MSGIRELIEEFDKYKTKELYIKDNRGFENGGKAVGGVFARDR